MVREAETLLPCERENVESLLVENRAVVLFPLQLKWIRLALSVLKAKISVLYKSEKVYF